MSDAAAGSEVLARLADALFEHVTPDGVAVYALGNDGKLRLAAAKGICEAVAAIEVDLDDMDELHRQGLLEPLLAATRSDE